MPAEQPPRVPEGSKIKVSALREGTVIDHLVAGTALKVLKILGLDSDRSVTIGLNLESKKMGHKDLIKIERHEVINEEVQKIALVSPNATFSIIRDFHVVQKLSPSLPEMIENLLRCPNPSCVTTDDRVRTKFIVVRTDSLRLRCHYCERTIRKDEIELL